MNKFRALTLLIVVFISQLMLPQTFQIGIDVTDGCNTFTIFYGVDPDGTDGYEPDLDIYAPPPPPLGAFDTRFTQGGEAYTKDIRNNSLNEKQFHLSYRSGTGCDEITLSWNSSILSALGTFYIVDDILGTLYGPIDMTTSNSLQVSSPLIASGLRILVTPFALDPPNVVLSIENQQAIGSDFFFDVFLNTTGTDILFLEDANLVLTFDQINFNSPQIFKEGVSPGYCTFIPSDQAGNNVTETRDQYYTSTTLLIQNVNELSINLNTLTPGSQTIFDSRIARIDNSINTHCLGRFKVSGITNPAGYMNLQWVTASTSISTFISVQPWATFVANVNMINPPNAALPVELNSFIATTSFDKVKLIWETQTEVNNYGFEIERSSSPPNEYKVWQTIGFVQGNGNSNSPKHYLFEDNNLFGGSRFVYRLKQIDTDGAYEYSDEVEVELLPAKYELFQNYPNPFNPTTNIKFSLPMETRLKINLYDMLGKLVATIADGMYEAGYHLVKFNATNLSSGTYIYRLESSEFVQEKKLLLLK